MSVCRNAGEAHDCRVVVDDAYTMDYSDVAGPDDPTGGMVYWCSACGPVAHRINKAIYAAFATRPGFAEEFAAAIEQAEDEET